MGTALTQEQVLALAPDASSASAAKGLSSDSKWVTLGTDADAVWGECQGSGSKPYQAQVDLGSLACRCSCPSRKFPCKHGLALLLLYAQQHPRFSSSSRPAWVDEWMNSRREKAVKKEKVAEAAATKATVDPAAAAIAIAKRETTRWKRIEAGTAELQRWIADQFRRGLAKFGPEQRHDWAAMAARMVDAQAPGLAPHLHSALDMMSAGTARYGDVVERLGLLQLVNEGVCRRTQLSPARLADLRSALGWAPDKEDVAAQGEALSDRWQVLGQVTIEADTKLTERRVWLRGIASGRYALLQEFAYGGRGWERSWRHAACYSATMRFFPGSVPLRALAFEVAADADPRLPAKEALAAAIDFASEAFATNPWLLQVPMLLDSATPHRNEQAWQLHTPAGVVPLQVGDSAGWALLAFSGGHPVSVMGEWNGRELRPLGAWHQSDRWMLESGA